MPGVPDSADLPTPVHTHIKWYVCTHVYTRVHSCIYTCVCTHVYMYVYALVYVQAAKGLLAEDGDGDGEEPPI